MAEKVFLVDISEFVGFSLNSIVDDVKKKEPIPLNQSDLAKALEEERDVMLTNFVCLIQPKMEKATSETSASSFLTLTDRVIMIYNIQINYMCLEKHRYYKKLVCLMFTYYLFCVN